MYGSLWLVEIWSDVIPDQHREWHSVVDNKVFLYVVHFNAYSHDMATQKLHRQKHHVIKHSLGFLWWAVSRTRLTSTTCAADSSSAMTFSAMFFKTSETWNVPHYRSASRTTTESRHTSFKVMMMLLLLLWHGGGGGGDGDGGGGVVVVVVVVVVVMVAVVMVMVVVLSCLLDWINFCQLERLNWGISIRRDRSPRVRDWMVCRHGVVANAKLCWCIQGSLPLAPLLSWLPIQWRHVACCLMFWWFPTPNVYVRRGARPSTVTGARRGCRAGKATKSWTSIHRTQA